MARKKSATKKNSTENKENVDVPCQKESENFSSKSPKFSNIHPTDALVDHNKSICSPREMNESEKNEILGNDLLDFANKYVAVDENVNVHRDTENDHHCCLAEKRSFDMSSCLDLDDVGENELLRVKRKCIELEKRIENIESFWNHPLEQINDLDLLSDNKPNTDHVGDQQNYGKHDLRLMKVPDISQDILSGLKRSNVTCTARSMVKYLFCSISQNQNLTLKNADSRLIDWIVCQAKELHPNDNTPVSKIRHAMANVLASLKHKKKRRLLDVNKSPE